MPLTPADVHDIAFKKPAIGRRGYDEEEVDAFLDQIERELARLVAENKALRAQVGPGGGRRGARTGPAAGPELAAELVDLKAQLDRLRRDKTATEQTVRAMRAELEQVGQVVGGDGEQSRVLMMAQRTADDHVADARLEAEKLLSDARSKADEITGEARAKADALERDARQRHQEAMAAVDADRTAALKRIEELRGFQQEYRARLKAHVESQLCELDGPQQELKAS